VLDSVEWYSPWGMAASQKSKDYCHQLEQIMCNGAKVEVTPMVFSDWEHDFTVDVNTKIGEEKYDLIIIRIGENVADIEGFELALEKLIAQCKKYANQVMITGCFWPNTKKEVAILLAAIKSKIPYVQLDHISKRTDVYPKIGDILYDEEGKPYRINKEFIITHPNDLGMRMIADEIYNKIKI